MRARSGLVQAEAVYRGNLGSLKKVVSADLPRDDENPGRLGALCRR